MTILAKPKETLLEHTENCLKVLKSIKKTYPTIPLICGIDNFWEHVFYALFFHDFGKAATGFQRILKDKKSPRWKYRHEILSAGFICSLGHIEGKYKRAIGIGIITHHKDLNTIRRDYQTVLPNGERTYNEKLHELYENFNELLSYFDEVPKLSKKYLGYEIDIPKRPKFEELEDVYKSSVLPYLSEFDEEEYTFLHGTYGIFLKGIINACDHLASASQFQLLGAIEDMSSMYNFNKLRKIQSLASKTQESSFLIAPTGSGKTEASLLWSDTNQDNNNSKRVYYILPYTASINAMYNRLQKDFKNEELVGIQHGKASYFLYKSFSNELDYFSASQRSREISNFTKKIYRPYKILTPFQIIKSFFGVKGFEMQVSEMTNSLFIFDEIHAYDINVTSLLLNVLKILKEEYSVKILIMSATLPTFLKNMFKEVLNISNEIKFDHDELNKFTRHIVKILDGKIENNLDLIKKDLKNNKKVLVVCNTVAKSQYIYGQLRDENPNSKLLHGRFILKDREKIEKYLDNLDLLVGTQAIEVSLDISYDILYSEPAPIDALIQRFGRVNRKGWENNKLSLVNIFTTGSKNDKFIYNPEIVTKTIDYLKNTELLSESKIQELMDKVYGKGYSEKDSEKFKRIEKSFKRFFEEIVPFINNEDSNSKFYGLFNSYEVIPQMYKLEYLEKIEKGEYYEAMGYFLSLTEGQFKKLESERNIEKIKSGKNKSTYFVNVEYDKELGLLINNEESNIL